MSVPPLKSFNKEVEMIELFKVAMWAVVGVFTYIAFVSLSHIILGVL